MSAAKDPGSDSVTLRLDVECRLIELVDEYLHLIEKAFDERHPPVVELQDYVEVHLKIEWALRHQVITESDHDRFAKAVILRSAILQRKYRIVIQDIELHTSRLSAIVEQVRLRIEQLGNGGDDTNVVQLRP
jgi:hypothetical protein